jgi:four helix bundle protein
VKSSAAPPLWNRGIVGRDEVIVGAHSIRVESFRDLIAWQRSMDLVVKCYKAAAGFPSSETYGLTGQIRRAASSTPANIAEGKGRGFGRAFVNHPQIASGSLCELETHLEIAGRLGLLNPAVEAELRKDTDDIGRLVAALRKSIESALK